MKASMFEDVKYKNKIKLLNSGAGVNTFLPPSFIKDDQATDLRNMTSSKYPASKVRNGKTQISTALTTVNGLGQRNNQYVHVVDGTVWKYWNGSAYVQVKAQGELTTVTLNAGGSGYSVNDIITIVQTGGSLGTIKVDTIGGGGAVATFSINTVGSGYSVANALSTTVLPSGGSGCKFNITAIGSLTSSIGTFEEFSTGTTKYTIFSNATNKYAWNGTAVTSLSNAPSSNIFTTHKGRIYWARDNDIVYSALNLINDYSTPNDAGTIDITQIKGGLVSLFAYSDRVWAFGEFSMHGLYGTGPANFELINIEGSVGNISDKGVAITNKKLYWVSYDGIYEFDGSTPLKVSEPYGGNGVDGGVTTFVKDIKTSLKSLIVSGSLGDYLYISIPYGASATTNNLTLVFDTKLRQWYVRDEGFLNFVTVGNTMYGVDTSGKLWDMSTTATTDGGTAISWYRITKAFNDGMASNLHNVGEVWLRFKLPIGSTASLGYSIIEEGTSFTDLQTFTPSASIQTVRVQLDVNDIRDAESYRLKIYGTGDFELHQMEIKSRTQMNDD